MLTAKLRVLTALAVLGTSSLLPSRAKASPDMPLQLSSPVATNRWSSSQNQKYYYAFWANSGQLQITIDSGSDSPGCAPVEVQVFDRERRVAGTDRLQRYGGGTHLACIRRANPKTFSINIREPRPLLMEVSVGDNSSRIVSGDYRITLSGAFSAQQPLLRAPDLERCLREPNRCRQPRFNTPSVPPTLPSPLLR